MHFYIFLPAHRADKLGHILLMPASLAAQQRPLAILLPVHDLLLLPLPRSDVSDTKDEGRWPHLLYFSRLQFFVRKVVLDR